MGGVHTAQGVWWSCVWNAVTVSALTQASGREFHSGTVLTKNECLYWAVCDRICLNLKLWWCLVLGSAGSSRRWIFSRNWDAASPAQLLSDAHSRSWCDVSALLCSVWTPSVSATLHRQPAAWTLTLSYCSLPIWLLLLSFLWHHHFLSFFLGFFRFWYCEIKR